LFGFYHRTTGDDHRRRVMDAEAISSGEPLMAGTRRIVGSHLEEAHAVPRRRRKHGFPKLGVG
jgi:hypothetical protein